MYDSRDDYLICKLMAQYRHRTPEIPSFFMYTTTDLHIICSEVSVICKLVAQYRHRPPEISSFFIRRERHSVLTIRDLHVICKPMAQFVYTTPELPASRLYDARMPGISFVRRDFATLSVSSWPSIDVQRQRRLSSYLQARGPVSS